MKVEAEVKIKILDGEEKGKVDTFRSVGETDTQCTEYGIIERLRLEWRHIHNVSSWGEPCGTDKMYTEELNAVRQELLDRGDEVVSFRQLVERFDDVEEAYKGVPWNLMQIYSNFNILIGKEYSPNILIFKELKTDNWIPISEKLPEKEGRYLTTVLNEHGNELRYIMICDYFSNGHWCPDDECASSNVIAWMPLPAKPFKPPKKSEDEK